VVNADRVRFNSLLSPNRPGWVVAFLNNQSVVV